MLAFLAAMLPVAYAPAANDTCPLDRLLSATEEVLLANRQLVKGLEEKRAVARALTTKVSDRTAALRAASDALLHTSRDLLGTICTAPAKGPELATCCARSGRLRLNEGHEAVAKQILARMAAQLAGRVPDDRVRIELGGYVAFDDRVWRYPDFLERAEKAFSELSP